MLVKCITSDGLRKARASNCSLAVLALQDCFGLTAHSRRKKKMNTTSRINLRISAVLLTLVGVAAAADQPGIRAALYPENERKHAPDFALQDATGKTVKIEDYRGKV